MKVRVDIPVAINVEPNMLRGDALADLEAQLLAQLAPVWRDAQTKVRADGFGGDFVPERTTFAWDGPARRDLDEPERRAIERRLAKAIAAASASRVTSDEAPVQAWVIHPPLAFRPRFNQFMAVAAPWWSTRYVHELAARAGEHYGDLVDGLAWVVDLHAPAKRTDVLSDVAGARLAPLGPGPFLLMQDRKGAHDIRALDPHRLAKLPELLVDQQIDKTTEDEPAGRRFLFAAVKEPQASTRPIAEFGEPFEEEVLFIELLAVSFPDANELQAQVGEIDWNVFLELYSSWPVKVRALPFTALRPVYGDVMKRLALAEIAKRDGAAPPFAHLFFASTTNAQELPVEIADRVSAWGAGETIVQASGYPWDEGRRGALVFPLLTDLAARVLAARFVLDLRAEARQLAHIVLELEDHFFTGADRLEAFEKFFLAWRTQRPKPMMEVLFAELDKLGAFTRLFDIILNHYELWGWMRIALIQNVIGTSFASRPEVQRLIARMNEIIHDVFFQITWDPATKDLVFVHGGEHVKAAGTGNPNPAAGVIGHVSDYFTRKGVVSRPKKETMERLQEPTQRKIQEIMSAMLCKPGETRTREELISEAVNAAADELKLDPEKDFDRVKMTMSYRVITVDVRTEHGVAAPYVTVEPVMRFSDGDWESTGPVQVMALGELDAELMSIQVDHEMKALTVFMLAEAILFTGGYVLVTAPSVIGAAIGLTIAISLREIIYYFTTPEADRDIEGYLFQALLGCIDMLGFRLAGAAAKALGIKIAAGAITSGTIARASTRIVLYLAKGLASSAVFGATATVEKFAGDMLHMTSCKRWPSPLDYLEEFGKGFAMGLICEFAVGPVLRVTGRAAIRQFAELFGSDAESAAKKIVEHVPPSEVEGLLNDGADRLEPALEATLKPEQRSLAKQFMDAFRKQIRDIVERVKALPEPKGFFPKLRAEWTTQSINELFESVAGATEGKVKLGKDALDAVARLVRTTSAQDMNAIVETLLRAPRLRVFLDANPKIGAQLLSRAFTAGPDELELMLGSFEKMSAEDIASTIAALLRVDRLSAFEVATLGRLAERAPAELAAFLRVAEVDELRALLRLAPRNPLVDNGAMAELLRLGASRPLAYNDVFARLELRVASGGILDGETVRQAIAESDQAAEEEALRVKQREARKSVSPERTSESIDKDTRFGQRKEDLEPIAGDAQRVADDLEKARIEQERYELMKYGDPARGGERRPLAFTSWEQYDEFKKEFEELVQKLGKGRPLDAQGQVIGSSTTFYSGNPDKPLGHYYDRKAPAKMGDVDVDLYAPDLARDMFREGTPAVQDKVLVGGERTIFQNSGDNGAYAVFPELREFNNRWSEELGREVDVKLRIDFTLPPKPPSGPIEFFRQGAAQ